jgi:Acyl-coenzyme A:6-aminopenicillanic acid acyl-transferase
MKKAFSLILYVFFLVEIAQTPIAACTGFMMDDGERVLVGNNEDYNIPYTRVWFIPSENGSFGRVYFGYDNWSPQGGMNDQGLFFDFFATKKLAVTKSKEKPKFQGPITDTMASQCASVEDVIKMFSRYNLESMSNYQMFVVDKSGDSAIIEGDDIIRKSVSYQVVTNFYQSKIAENLRPCHWPTRSCMRYRKAANMLSLQSRASIAQFRKILDETHQDTVFGRTLYSNIYDLNKGLIYLYYYHDFDNVVVIDLKKELRLGRHYYELPSLFGKKPKYSQKTFTYKDPAFTILYPKHYKVIAPKQDEVLLVKSPMSKTPALGVYVEDKPQGIRLKDIGQKYFTGLIQKYSTDVELVSSIQTVLSDGTPAVELLFHRVVNEHWHLQTMILSTYRDDKLIFAAVTSFAHPEALKDYLYSLRFD